MEKIIEVRNLQKSFGDVKAVSNIDFYVEKGKFFAFLGPNGAGKSTTIDMICTLLKPDEGEIIIDGKKIGKDDAKIRESIGVVFQESILDSLLTVKENLQTRAKFYTKNKDQIKEVVKTAAATAGVENFLNRPYGKLSGGQRRRADIARSLVNTPKILFLDEPTTGLDPQTRKNVWETIYNLQKEHDMTVFLTTHYMEEAAAADYIIIIDNGEIVAKGTPLELKEKYSSDTLKIQTKNDTALISILEENNLSYFKKNGRFEIKLKQTKDALPILKEAESFIDSFEVVNGTMDDVFITITGREIRSDA